MSNRQILGLKNIKDFIDFWEQFNTDLGFCEMEKERLRRIPMFSILEVNSILKEFKDNVEESNKKE